MNFPEETFFKGKFYVITPLSVYEIVTGGLWSGVTAHKIATREPYDLQQRQLGQPLYGGIFLAITRNGILKYGGCTYTGPFQKPGQKAPVFDQVSRKRRGTYSDTVVALCFDLDQAFTCHDIYPKESFDPRWEESTREVLQKIGHEHPFIGLCLTGPEALPLHIHPPRLAHGM